MTQHNATSALMVRDITRSLPLAGNELPILHGISFALKQGDSLAITGPSGSGKSTLLGILAGLDTPNSGEVWLAGQNIARLNENQLARFRNRYIGMVFQSFNLIPTLTALENVELPLFAQANQRNTRQRAQELLEMVGLGDRLHHLPGQLSGGQQQRVAIARALINQPDLLIADEPTGNLDSATGKAILALFERLQAELNLSVIIATHDPQVARRADQRLHIIDGRLAEVQQ